MEGILHISGRINFSYKESTFVAVNDFSDIVFMGGLMLAEIDFSKRAFIDNFVLVDNIGLNSFSTHFIHFIISCNNSSKFHLLHQAIHDLKLIIARFGFGVKSKINNCPLWIIKFNKFDEIYQISF